MWANSSNCNIDKLQSVQNFACRIVSGARKFDHVTPILKELEWLPVSSQLYYRSATLAFKCMMGCAPAYLTSIFIKHTTRSSQQLNIPLFRTATGQRTFYYRTTTIWNSLDLTLKLSRTILTFKRALKRKFIVESPHGER